MAIQSSLKRTLNFCDSAFFCFSPLYTNHFLLSLSVPSLQFKLEKPECARVSPRLHCSPAPVFSLVSFYIFHNFKYHLWETIKFVSPSHLSIELWTLINNPMTDISTWIANHLINPKMAKQNLDFLDSVSNIGNFGTLPPPISSPTTWCSDTTFSIILSPLFPYPSSLTCRPLKYYVRFISKIDFKSTHSF